MDHGNCDRNDLICKVDPFFEAIRSTSWVIGAFGAYCVFASHTMVSGLANLPLFPATLRLTGVSIVFIVEVPTIFVTTGTCLTGTKACGNPDQFLFWDGIHPTTAAHRILAQRAFDAVREQLNVGV